MVWALQWSWVVPGYVTQGYRCVEALLESNPAQSLLSAKGTALSGYLAFLHGDFATARDRSERAISIFQQKQVGGLEDPAGLAYALTTLAVVTGFSGDPSACRAMAEESVKQLTALGHLTSWGIGRALLVTAHLALGEGDYAVARAWYEQGLELFRKMGDNVLVALALNYLGDMARIEGHYARAGLLYKEALPLFEELQYKSDIPAVLHNLGYVHLAAGEYQRAAGLFAESLALQQELGNRAGIAECLAGFAAVAGVRGQPERAARLFGAAHALRCAIGAEMWPGERVEWERHVRSVRVQLDPGTWDQAWAKGQTIGVEQAITEALAESMSAQTAALQH